MSIMTLESLALESSFEHMGQHSGPLAASTCNDTRCSAPWGMGYVADHTQA